MEGEASGRRKERVGGGIRGMDSENETEENEKKRNGKILFTNDRNIFAFLVTFFMQSYQYKE